ncbi:MAG: heparinase [Armatimonadetes bacterium]|nr:heparinase [Armatimonadota bacterium]
MSGALTATSLLLLLTTAALAAHPVLPVRIDKSQAASYANAVAGVMAMSEADLLAIIPEQSGIYFTDCPNCEAGLQEGQFAPRNNAAYAPWEPSHPLVMRCAFCGHEYPSEQYPMTGKLSVRGPNGRLEEYPYWEDARGYRHFFEARIDDLRIRSMENAGWRLGRAYAATGEAQYARRCALVLQRFAQVYPGYCYHFDYPFQQKVIHDGDVDPKDFRPGFRTARWTWWAYMDLPERLVEAYDLIYESGELEKLSAEKGHDVKAEIEGFFTTAAEGVLANRDDMTNMSPGMWASVISAGRVLGRPEWVHEMVGRLGRFVDTGFHYDGTWSEGAPSYHAQVVGSLSVVANALQGYSDPAGYEPPAPDRRYDNLDATTGLPGIKRARESLDLMRLPNGRRVPVHDTWSTDNPGALTASQPYVLPGLGHGCLAGGEGDGQWQAHLTWSAGQGHQHDDGLSLLIFCQGQEMLSDLGYSHSRDRAWTLPTAAHNTVVIDSLTQVSDRTTYGALRYFHASEANCQVVSVDNRTVYPNRAQTYRRTLVAVAGQYLVDLFEVAGGQQHDYFLHGCADLPGSVRAEAGGQALPTEALETLVPSGVEYAEAMNEGECGLASRPGYAYGYLRDLQRVKGPLPASCALEYTLEGSPATLRAHVLTQPGDELVVGRNPAVRGAKENDNNLRDCWRPFAALRRNGGESLFAAVLDPLAGTPAVTSVRRLEWPGVALAVEIAVADRTDLLLLRPQQLAVEWQGKPLSATAELVVLTASDATVVDGKVTWGGLALEAAPSGDHPLVALDSTEGTLTVQGELLPPAGTIVLLDHAGQRVSPFTVTAAERVGDNSRLTVAERVALSWDAATQTSTFICQPRTSYQGPHVVRFAPVAHATP